MVYTPPENQPAAPVTIEFTPEGYRSEVEQLEALRTALAGAGLEPEQLVYSGFAGPAPDGRPTRHTHIFAMNEAAWRQASTLDELTPLGYASQYDVPCIGVYDKKDLTEVYHYAHTADFTTGNSVANERIEIEDVTPGHPLQDWPADEPFNGPVVHATYPEGAPSDALVGLVLVKPA